MTYKSAENTESTSSIINSLSDLMLARLEKHDCDAVRRDELSTDDLLAAFDEQVICLRQAVLMLRDSADEDTSHTSIRDCAVAVGVATARIAYALGNL